MSDRGVAHPEASDYVPLVTVITPTYNHARFIGECIESVKAQTYPRWEQIIVDDGSTDDTARAVSARLDPRIRYERQEHVGILALAHTYNRALREAKGDVVAILEGDDLWRPEMLATVVPRLADPDVVVAYGRTILAIGSRLYETKSIPQPSLARTFGAATLSNEPRGAAGIAMLHGGVGAFTFPCAAVIRRATLDAIGGFQYFPGLGAVDLPTFVRLSLCGRFAFSDRVVAYWRRHPAAASWIRHEQQLLGSYAFARAFLREHGDELSLRDGELSAIERSWRRHLKRAAFNAGRQMLVQRKWPQARVQFARAARSPDPAVVCCAVIGWLASFARLDIERVMSVAGMISFPRESPRAVEEFAHAPLPGDGAATR